MIRFIVLMGHSSCSDKSGLRRREQNWRQNNPVKGYFNNLSKGRWWSEPKQE